MATRLRLQRYGKKDQAFYHIVVADGRAPRDGKYIDLVGTYNPNANPAKINIDFEKSIKWLQNGAQPTDTVKNILREEGVVYKYHLLKGVAKGAFSLDKAEEKFNIWKTAKENRISDLKNKKLNETKIEMKKRLEAEAKKSEERRKAIEAKATKQTEVVEETPTTEENTEA